MRESLTVLAILLIMVLTTALVGPYFVDWNAHRNEIETRLSSLLGAKFVVAGPIDVKLLPRPIFRLQEVTVSGGSLRDGKLAADRIDLELALTALLRGEVRFIEADISQPQLTLSVGKDHSVMLPSLRGDPDRISLNHVALHDGTLTLVGLDGETAFRATGLTGDGDAESLHGPFRFGGHVDTARGTQEFRLATGAYDGQKIRLKSTLDPLAGSPKAEIEGTLASTPAADGASALTFDGTLAAASQIPLAGGATVIPWNVITRLHGEAGQIAVSELELRVGADGRALVATGSGHVDFGAATSASLSLHAKQADAARLVVSGDGSDQSGGDPQNPPAPPPIADDVAALEAFTQNADAFAFLPIPVAVDFGIDTVSLGDATLANLAGTVNLAAGVPATGTVSIEGADGSRLRLDGSFEPGSAAVFKGSADVAVHDLPRFADGLAQDLPDAADWLKRTFPVKAFGFSGGVDLSGVGFAAHDATLKLDRSTFAGTITLTRAVGQDRARLFADLTSEALDLDALPDWRSTADTVAGLDLSLALSARAIRLARSDTGSVNAGRITLQLSKTGSSVALDRLSFADVGGATAEITGRSDAQTAHVDGRFDARKLGDLLNVIHRVVPSVVTDELLTRADTLSPALFGITADGAWDADGGLTPSTVSIDGTAAGTKVSLHLRPDAGPAVAADPLAQFRTERPPFTVSLLLDAPETGALLRQLGLKTPPSTAIGHGRIEATARLSTSGVLDGNVAASFADTLLTFKGSGKPPDDLAGHLTLHGPNVAPLLRAVTLASPDVGTVWPAEADADVTWREGRMTTKGLAGRVIGTRFSGDLSFVPSSAPSATTLVSAPATIDRPPAEPPELTGALTIDRLPVLVLAGLALGPLPAAKAGATWPEAPFAPTLLHLPRSDIALTVAALPLLDPLVGRDAKLTLQLAPGVVTLTDLSAALGQGRIGATVTFRRDGGSASVSGHVDWNGLPLTTPSLGGRSQGALDLAGTGATASMLVASLAGSGSITVDDARLPRFEPGAITRVIAGIDAATTSIDETGIGDSLAHELDQGALSLGPVTAPVTVAAGVLRANPVTVDGPAIRSDIGGSLDLRSLLLSLKATAILRAPPKDWSGGAPQVGVNWKGPFWAPAREIDAASLVNGLAARAIAREQARIEAFQEDVRERAFFNRRLRAIEAEEQAARDKARADQEAERQKALARPPLEPLNIRPTLPKPDVLRSDLKGEPVPKSESDPLSRFLDSLKLTPAVTAPLPTPHPLPRPGAPPKPVELRHGSPIEAAAPTVVRPGDPASAGRN